jgi:methyltransferase-like protein
MTQNFLEHFSEDAQDLYGRIYLNAQKLKNSNWGLLFLKDGSEENYDEFLMCEKQKESTTLTQEEAEVIEPLLQELHDNWNLALRVENIYSYLEDLKNKYHNQYVYPKFESESFINIVENYLKLMKDAEGNKMAQDKIEQNVLHNLLFLEGKILLPDLRMKYPTLFK